jgi:polar amino acid transport system permease protein
MQYNFNWDVVWRNFDRLSGGLALGLEMAAVALLLGSIIGFACALLLVSKQGWTHRPVRIYVEFIRNSPLLVLVFYIYFGLPVLGVSFLDNVESFTLTLAVYAGAYLTEVFRAGLASVPQGYLDAGTGIGLSYRQRLFYVVLPVTFRIVLPSLSNSFISLFKDTALATAIAVPELTFGAGWINVHTFQVIEVWTVTGALYLGTSYLIAFVLRLIERRYVVIR